MSVPSPTVRLNSDTDIPQLGFGVFKIPDEETARTVSLALDAGYRSIDTASLYRNEAGVGQAIRTSGIAREELFITTKLWNSDQGRDLAPQAFEKSLERLGLDYVDLYLIHWPTPERGLFEQTWEVLEEILQQGRTKAIGVSNFYPEHLQAIADLGGTLPAVNQIECHPRLQQRSLIEAADGLGIRTQAWSPLATGQVLDSHTVVAIAQRLDRTPAQVVLRWHLQQGRIVIPKSATPARIAENIAVFDFELSPSDLSAIDALEADGRIGPHPLTFNRA